MNQRFGAALAWGCLGLVVLGMSAAPSALAALTSIGFALDHTDEPNLLGINPFPGNQNPSVIETLYGEHNVRRVDDDRDDLFVFTQEVATFTLVARFSKEPFGLNAADSTGAGIYPIMFIPHDLMGYSFFAPWQFEIGREDFPPAFQLHYDGSRVRLSSDSDALRPIFPNMTNNAGRDHLVTFQVIGNDGHPNNPIGSYVFAWDDGMSRFGDRDFQDTVIEVSGIAPAVPEPSSAVLVGFATLVGGVYFVSRRRRSGGSFTQSSCTQLGGGVAIVAMAFAFLATPALAALTPVGNAMDHTNEPNLLGFNPFPENLNPSVIETLYGEHNVRRVDDAFDRLFVFTQNQATFEAVAQFSDNPFSMAISIPGTRNGGVSILRLPAFTGAPGYPGYDIPEPRESVIARSSVREPVFRFAITARNGGGLWSDPIHNNSDLDRLLTFEVVGNEGHPDNPIGSFVLCWEDQGFVSSDGDFQDLVVEVTGIGLAVPEPSSAVMGTLAALGAFVWHLRRTSSHPLASL